jgi:drug/metabolite transporter (DMT)-like permease
MQIEASLADRLQENAPLVVAFLLLVDSLHFVFARLLLPYLPPVTSALFVLGVATAETAVFLALRRAIHFTTFRRHLWFFLLIGFLVAFSTSLNYAAVAFIDLGTAALLARTSIIFSLCLGLLWLKERLNRMEWLGTGVALIGIFIITFQPGDYLRLGSLFVVASSFMYALHAAIFKRYGSELDFANFFLFRVASTSGFLLLFALGRSQLTWPSWPAWLILLFAGTVDVVISRVLYYLALRRLSLTFHTIILTLSPVITILWSLFLFGEWPTRQGVIGGTAVIIGVAIVTLRAKE